MASGWGCVRFDGPLAADSDGDECLFRSRRLGLLVWVRGFVSLAFFSPLDVEVGLVSGFGKGK